MAYQKYPDFKQLEKDINANKLEKIYLFLGEEEGEKEKFIQKIIDKSFDKKEEKNYSVCRFHSEYGELHAAHEFILSESMFSCNKICILLNINTLKPKGEDVNLFTELLENSSLSNKLIMTSIENKIPLIINNKYTRIIKIIQFWKYFENDINIYIVKSLKKSGIEIQRQAINLLIDFTGRDIKKIDEALLKIINSGEKAITPDIIRFFIQDEKEVSVFGFIDSLFQKNKNTFLLLSKILDAGNHELAILKLIMREAELIERYYYLIDNNITNDNALKEIGISQRNTTNFLNSSRKYSKTSIKKIFPLIYKTDYRLKSYNYTGNLSSNPLFKLVSEILIENPD